MEDKEIVDLYFKRDEQAIRETEQKYGQYCFTVAYRILYENRDSEECVSDTWLQAWNTIPPQRPSLLKYYLAKITRYFAVNRLRTRTRQKRGGNEADIALEELEAVLSDGNDPEKEYDRNELIRVLNRFLKMQKAQDRDLFIRRYFYAEPVKEIAERYGMRENAVSLRLSRTREKLKETLRKEGYV
ncbi:MAG: sigma-70 family RNA polymerase sigma factor [Solobacterium sp.]|nr:sigma-70 family RNA polymerase sigma factor [Solobacterium sp.]